jgi:RNA polymerase sigma-70 factor, ECF subfamily
MRYSREKDALRQLDDNALAAALASGQHDALEIIIERYRPVVYAIARRIVKDAAETDDTVQEIFVQVFREIDKFDPQLGAFLAWLKKLAKARALDRKKHLGRTGVYSALPLDEAIAVGVAGRETPETTTQVQELLAMLETEDRLYFVMNHMRGYTAKEIAAATGGSVFSVKRSLAASRRKLASVLPGNSWPRKGKR